MHLVLYFVDLIQNDDKIYEKKTYFGELSVLC
jgi:hypothetical protein